MKIFDKYGNVMFERPQVTTRITDAPDAPDAPAPRGAALGSGRVQSARRGIWMLDAYGEAAGSAGVGPGPTGVASGADRARLRNVVSDAVEAGESLRCADLRGADLHGLDLRGADLRGADLRGVDLRESMLTKADLSDANLEGADMRHVVLDGAILAWAKLSRTDLSHARMVGTILRKATYDAVEEFSQ